MYRFFHECFSDPALATVIAVALILAFAMAWFVFMDRLKKRQKRQRRQRRRRETKGTVSEPAASADEQRQNPLGTQGNQEP